MNSNALDGLNWNLSAIAYGLRALPTPTRLPLQYLGFSGGAVSPVPTISQCAPPSLLTHTFVPIRQNRPIRFGPPPANHPSLPTSP